MRQPAPDYSSRQYERPNQPWVCGLASDGQACPAGPTARGQCPALAECAPVRDADRWQCNRSPLRGGVCAEGPTPDGGCGRVHRCRPVRSLRAIRGRFVTACTLLTAGGLLILLSAEWRDRVISPGPLAAPHAQILAREPSESTCAACHAAADRSVAGWTASLVAGHGNRPTQSQRCLECHGKTISAEFALTAHTLPQKGSELFSSVRTKNSSDPFSHACATCHGEHRGARFDLTAMDNDRCQACHQQRFESFAKDHPDFGAWPYERRTRIAFDHASHSTKHFTESKRAFDCRACHLEDSTGAAQRLANYETACASCHDEKIATSVTQGMPMLALPTLDIDVLKTAGHDVGAWPEEATGDFDGRLPPVMKLLLAGDPSAAEAMNTLGADFEFFDIHADDPEQLAACAALAVAMKKLFNDLSPNGPAAARERLEAALCRDISDAGLAALLAGLPLDMTRSAIEKWFPNTNTNTNDDNRRRGLRAFAASVGGGRPLAYAPAGVWRRDDATLTIRYQPAGHADPVLTGWLELFAATPDLARQPLALAMFKELSNPTAAGLCASCHRVEQTAAGQLTINWRAYDRTTEPRGFTKFSHAPHLLLPQLADCAHCHAIDESRNAPAVYTDANLQNFASEFAPISKRQCVECHTARAAGDSCQQCHNYHVDGIESWRLGTRNDEVWRAGSSPSPAGGEDAPARRSRSAMH